MQLRNTIIALVALALIGGIAFYAGRHPESDKNHKLFDLAADDIAKIELHGPARDLLIERGGPGLWRIVKPVATAADNGAVDAMATAIANLEVIETVDEHPTDLANFGLENPAVTVTVTRKDGRVLPGIMIGRDTPVGSNAYIKLTDKPAVLLIGAGFTAESGRTLKDLRSHALISLTADQMKRATIKRGDGSTIEAVRDGDKWKLTKPRAYPADKEAVGQLLSAIASVRIDDFIEEHPADLEKFGLVHPSLEFAVSGGKDDVEQSAAIGFRQPEAGKSAVFVRPGQGDRPICTVGDYIVKTLDKSFDDLRDKSVLPFDESRVARMTIIGGPVSIVVERGSDGKWTVLAGGRTAPAQPEVAVSMLGQLHDLKGSRIVEDPMSHPERFGMVHPTLTITLYDQAGGGIGSINLAQIEATAQPEAPGAKPVSKTFGYATSSADKAVYEVTPAQIVDLENTASTLKGSTEPQAAASASPVPAASPAAMLPPPPSGLPPAGATP